MLNLKFLPIHFSFFLIIGILLGYNFEISTNAILTFALIFLSFLIFFYYKSLSSFKPLLFFGLFMGLLFVLIGVLGVKIQMAKNQKYHYSNNYNSNDQLLLKVGRNLKSSQYYFKYEASVLRVDRTGTFGKVLINIDKSNDENPLITDDIILTKNNLKVVNQSLNPNEFNYSEYLKKQGIYHQLRLKGGDFLNLGVKKKSLIGIAFKIRQRINQNLIKYNFSKEELSLINALLLGQRQDISKETLDSYKKAGAIHILAVSGLHIGVILLFLNFLLRPLENFKNGKGIKLLILVIVLWMYAVIAGMSASIVRAVTMFTSISVGLGINRPSSVRNSLIVSIFILLLIKPLLLFDVGFQLSYTAVFSIVWIYPLFKKLVDPKVRIIRYFWQLLSVSFAAQIGVLPLSLYYFHQFPGLFFISSLVIIPFLGIILGAGIIIIILALTNLLPQFFADFYASIIGLLNEIVAVISHEENFIFQNISFSLLLMITCYILILATINFLYHKKVKTLLLLLVSIILIQINLIYEKKQNQRTNEFIVFHQVKNSIIGNRIGNKMKVYQNEDRLANKKNRIITSYKAKFANLQIQKEQSIKNIMGITTKKLLIIDSAGIYNNQSFRPEIIILIQSPKINLQRLLYKLDPKIIIADGSNYKSFINLWEKSCNKSKTTFHNTSVNGAFVYSYKP